jgi:DNA-binding HxlR family transcriptional regulator
MSRTDTSQWPCTIARAADLLGDGWNLLIVRQACLGARRFEDFHDGLGIGRNVLTRHLNLLVDEGVFARVPYQDRPLRHEYRLTDKGRDIFPVLLAMAAWAERWTTGPEGTPLIFSHTRCDHDMHGEVVCSHCREIVGVREVRVRPGPGHPGSSGESLGESVGDAISGESPANRR